MKIKTEILLISISLLAAYSMFSFTFSKIFWLELLLGWLISYLNHVIDWNVKLRSLQNTPEVSVRQVTAANLFRILLLLTIVFCIISFFSINHVAFIYSLLLCYIIFMTSDLVSFYKAQKNHYERKV